MPNTMLVHRFTVVFALLASSAAATAGAQPFTVRDLVSLDRLSEVVASPDGKRVAYTLRSTDMEANKARTGIWLQVSARHGGAESA